jgi:16S rRNA (cytosine967-C5)-methyltransferase
MNPSVSAVAPRPMHAREIALRVLSDLRGGRRTARQEIDALASAGGADAREVSLATELVMGVLRHRLTLGNVIRKLGCQGWKRTNERLKSILLLAGYQLLWLDAVPAFAAVNEAVEQAKGEAGARGGKFVNAVLRTLLREIEQRRIPGHEADATRSIPIDASVSCQFRKPVLPDPAQSLAEYLADATSHPMWLVSRWLGHYGKERTTGICAAGISRPPTILRPNRLRIDAAGLAERLKKEGLQAELLPGGEAVLVQDAGSLVRSAAFTAGLFQPQDRTAMSTLQCGCGGKLIAGQTVLDLCAGLGTKSTQAAEMLGGRGLVLACDKDEPKLHLLVENCERLGHGIVRTTALEGLEQTVAGLERLDWVLVDAPCSNTGVLARRPEARYRLSPRDLEMLQATQLEILDRAARLARPQTRLLYSTCSIEPEENEEVSKKFAAAHPGWGLRDAKLTLPEVGKTPADWRDGGYWASWERD